METDCHSFDSRDNKRSEGTSASGPFYGSATAENHRRDTASHRSASPAAFSESQPQPVSVHSQSQSQRHPLVPLGGGESVRGHPLCDSDMEHCSNKCDSDVRSVNNTLGATAPFDSNNNNNKSQLPPLQSSVPKQLPFSDTDFDSFANPKSQQPQQQQQQQQRKQQEHSDNSSSPPSSPQRSVRSGLSSPIRPSSPRPLSFTSQNLENEATVRSTAQVAEAKRQKSLESLANIKAFIRALTTHKQKCVDLGDYVTASETQRRIDELQADSAVHEAQVLRSKQVSAMLDLESDYTSEFRHFNELWELKERECSRQWTEYIAALKKCHQTEVEERRAQFESLFPYRPMASSELLDLRHREREMVKQGLFLDAALIKQRADDLENQQRDEHHRKWAMRVTTHGDKFAKKHVADLESAEVRYQNQLNELRRVRQIEYQKLVQRYHNIKNQTQSDQCKEWNKAQLSKKGASNSPLSSPRSAPAPITPKGVYPAPPQAPVPVLTPRVKFGLDVIDTPVSMPDHIRYVFRRRSASVPRKSRLGDLASPKSPTIRSKSKSNAPASPHTPTPAPPSVPRPSSQFRKAQAQYNKESSPPRTPPLKTPSTSTPSSAGSSVSGSGGVGDAGSPRGRSRVVAC